MLPLILALTLSGQPQLLLDIEPSAATDSETFLEVDTGADPNVLVVENDFWGIELFNVTSDNMRSLIADLCPGPCSSNPQQLTRVGTHLVFLATDLGEEFANQLWVTDGTEGGTFKLADAVDNSRTQVARLIPLGDQVLFMKGGDVWVSDGTRAGTAMAPWGNRRQLVSAAMTATHRFVSVNDQPQDRCQVLVTELDVRQATERPMPNPSPHCSEALATNGERGVVSLASGLWRFEPTGAPVLIDPVPATHLTQVGSNLYFFRTDASGLSLFVSTGEPAGTLALGTVPTSATGLEHVGVSGNRLLFSYEDPMRVHRLHGSDGTVAGTEPVAKLLGPTYGIMAVGPEAFVADGVENGAAEVLETDGSSTGTSVLQGVFPFNFTDRLGYRGARGHSNALNLIALVVNELGAFRIRPGESPETVFLKPANPVGSSPQPAILHGGEAFFTAGWDPGVFRTDGTPDGSTRFTDGGLVGFAGDRVLVSEATGVSSVLIASGEKLGLDAGTVAPQAVQLKAATVLVAGDNPRILWSTDGTPGGTRMLADLGAVTRFPWPLELSDGRAVVPAERSLWFTDGTTAGTRKVDLPNANSLLLELPAANGAWVLWAAATGAATLSLVTAESSQDLKSWPTGAVPFVLSSNGNQLYFLFRAGGEIQLWSAGPSGVAQKPPTGLVSARAVTFFRDQVLVLGDRGDGEGAFVLGADGALSLLAPARGATFLHAEGDLLFADVASPHLGLELHVYDEALHLFLPTGDLSYGVGSSSPSPPQKVGTHYLFSAWTPEAGREPWSWTPEPPPVRGCGCDAGGGAGLALALLLLAGVKRRVSF